MTEVSLLLFGFSVGALGVAGITLLIVRGMCKDSKVKDDVIAALAEYQELMQELDRQADLERAFSAVVNGAPGIEEL